MNVSSILYSSLRNFFIVAAGVIAVGALLSPQSARAQEVLAGSATGAEAQSGNGATATNAFDLAGGSTARS